jgi:hypothetical protein
LTTTTEAELEQQYPHAQTGQLPMPQADHDPPAEEQEAFYLRFVEEHPGAGRVFSPNPSRPQFKTSEAAQALLEWRTRVAGERWTAALHAQMAPPGCTCCGEPTTATASVGGRTRPLCSPCLGVVRAVMAERAGVERVGKRTRRQAAEALLEQLGS